MSQESFLLCIFWFLVICFGYLILFRLRRRLPYLALRILLTGVGILLLCFLLGTLNILPNSIGIAFLFIVEALSFSWTIYIAGGFIVLIGVVVMLFLKKR